MRSCETCEVESERDQLKAELEVLKSTTPRSLYESLDLWKSRAEKLAEALKTIKKQSPGCGGCKQIAKEALDAYGKGLK